MGTGGGGWGVGGTFSERQRDTGSDRVDTGDGEWGVGGGEGRCVPVIHYPSLIQHSGTVTVGTLGWARVAL